MNVYEPNIGTLYVVSTPIGNLGDITVRALKILEKIDIIFVENINITNILLKRYNITKPFLISCNKNNEYLRCKEILKYIYLNKTIALLSSAGTPTISDPGKMIINTVKKNNFTVVPLPGPVAFTTGLPMAEFETDKFYFQGFLPKLKKERKDTFKYFKKISTNVVFYESKHRIQNSITDLLEILPNNHLLIAKELTKKFESFFEGDAKSIINMINNNKFIVKGEFVVFIKKFQYVDHICEYKNKILKLIECMLKNNISIKTIILHISCITNLKKSEIYDLTLNLKKNY